MTDTLTSAIDRMPDLGVDDGEFAAAPARDTIDLSGVFGILLRQWWLILAVTLIFVGAGLGYLALADKIYSATARVLIDPRDKQIVGTDVVRPSQGTDAGWIETQVDLITSASTLSKVVQSQDLIDDPEFGGDGSKDRINTVLTAFAEHVRAERTADTYVVDVTVSSISAEKSARLANAVAAAFVEASTEAKQGAVRQANELLLRQIDDLKTKASAADQAVQAYRQENGLVQIVGEPVDEQTLKQLNEANVAAKLKADAAAERWRKIDALAKSGSGDFGPALASLDSPLLSRLQVEYAIGQKQQAEFAQTLGPQHPKMTAIEADLARTRTLIRQELASLADRARVDADLAGAQAAATQSATAAAMRQVSDNSQASVRLRDLESEASIRRDVLKAFVARTQETGLQENLQVSDIRIVTPAQVPVAPSAPRRKVILGLATIGGLGAGLSLALYRGRNRRGAAPRRAPAFAAAAPPAAPALAPHLLAELSVPALLAGGGLLSEGTARETIERFGVLAARPLDRLVHRLVAPGETDGPAVHVVFGTASSGAIAAVAYGLACAMAGSDTETLLIDANGGAVNLGAALIGADAPGILDVHVDGVDPDSIAARLDGAPVVVLPAASPARRDALASHGDSLVETIADIADDFERIVIDLGASCPPALFGRLSEIADDVIMVVDEDQVATAAMAEMFRDLRALVPELRGIVSVHAAPLAVDAGPPPVPA